jgi:hypothetical protein
MQYPKTPLPQYNVTSAIYTTIEVAAIKTIHLQFVTANNKRNTNIVVFIFKQDRVVNVVDLK